ncbi:MAG: hypothetical protein F2563_00565 [Actinobacteria bacterium]|jgi:hypothetical protein|uniref:Unannotated protein n=1 Tax=freshwater metagenome TaxID=449393 RepID=A0A6J6DVD4_9ZZZZ|nr:hypothetical protein [Actinomycetota bacterium]
METKEQNVFLRDVRTPEFFRDTTFSLYKKTDVFKATVESMYSGDVDRAMHWTAELHCSGMIDELFEIYLNFYINWINTANPNFPKYFFIRMKEFEIIKKEYQYTPLEIRNNLTSRRILCELTAIMAYSRKRPGVKRPTLKDRMFDLIEVTSHCRAKDTEAVDHIIKPRDPPELIIPINELANAVSHLVQDCENAARWIQWLIEWEKRVIKKERKYECDERDVDQVDPKFYRDIVWLIWDVLKYETRRRRNPLLSEQLNYLFEIYCSNFNGRTKKQKRGLFFVAIMYLTEKVDYSRHVYTDIVSVRRIIENHQEFYKEIKETNATEETYYNVKKIEDEIVRKKEMKANKGKLDEINAQWNDLVSRSKGAGLPVSK